MADTSGLNAILQSVFQHAYEDLLNDVEAHQDLFWYAMTGDTRLQNMFWTDPDLLMDEGL